LLVYFYLASCRNVLTHSYALKTFLKGLTLKPTEVVVAVADEVRYHPLCRIVLTYLIFVIHVFVFVILVLVFTRH